MLACRLIVFIVLFFFSLIGYAAPLQIVAAENFYGDIAKQIGGPYVNVFNIINHPNQDPHLFTASAKVAKKIADADIIIYNGVDYDGWMKPLLTNIHLPINQIIEVASLIQLPKDGNPHIWYLPATTQALTTRLTALYIQLDPAHKTYFLAQQKKIQDDFQIILMTIERLRAKFPAISVTATEPVYNALMQQMGFSVMGEDFQRNIMNDVTPSISQIKAFELALNQHQVRLLIYNKQVHNPLSQRMLRLAQQNHIPVVGVTETLPPTMTFQQWMLQQLLAVEQALTHE